MKSFDKYEKVICCWCGTTIHESNGDGIKLSVCQKCEPDYKKFKLKKKRLSANKRYQKNKLKQKTYRDKRYEFVRKTVFEYYCGGMIRCMCCGENNIKFLTIDHIKGRKKWNHKNNFSGFQLWSWIIRNGFPPGLQVLCYNCNCAKGIFGICPHNKEIVTKLIDDDLFLKVNKE